tara:strand:- start:527 stop:1597 length:1071 start_codon:yes stop_codon:yes gene_type:complete
MNIAKKWVKKYFSDPEAIILSLLLLAALLFIIFLGRMLAPFIAAIILAYLLEGLVVRLERIKFPHWLAVVCVFLLFLSIVVFALFLILPLLWQQTIALASELPLMVNKTQTLLLELPQKYPDLFTLDQVTQVLSQLKGQMAHLGQKVFSLSVASIPNVIELTIYLILVPLMIYFMLMDRDVLVNMFTRVLPKDKKLLTEIWREVDQQFGNYVRGKVLEITIVAVISYIGFVFFHLNYAMLLAVLCGFSVLIPFIGVTIVTVPVFLIAYTQFGWSTDLAYVAIFYSAIMVLDGNVLVPLLFSEAVNLHPVMILLAVLLFGGIWGFWGVFFAIPLATVVKAICNAWPRQAHSVMDHDA